MGKASGSGGRGGSGGGVLSSGKSDSQLMSDISNARKQNRDIPFSDWEKRGNLAKNAFASTVQVASRMFPGSEKAFSLIYKAISENRGAGWFSENFESFAPANNILYNRSEFAKTIGFWQRTAREISSSNQK